MLKAEKSPDEAMVGKRLRIHSTDGELLEGKSQLMIATVENTKFLWIRSRSNSTISRSQLLNGKMTRDRSPVNSWTSKQERSWQHLNLLVMLPRQSVVAQAELRQYAKEGIVPLMVSFGVIKAQTKCPPNQKEEEMLSNCA